MNISQLITEKLIPYIYQSCDGSVLKELEQRFLDKNKQLQHQFMDWLAYDYPVTKEKSFTKVYLSEHREGLKMEEVQLLQRAADSYLGLYEINRVKGQDIHLKNLFTEDRHIISSEDLGETPEGNELVLARINHQGQDKILSSNVILLPYQFKTMLVGQIIESYDRAKIRHSYFTYGDYFKKHPLEVMEIINKLLSYEDQEGDCTLYQSVYIVSQPEQFKKALIEMKDYLQADEDQIYCLMYDDDTLATLVYQNNRLEVECTSSEDLKLAKELLTEKLGSCLHHLKDEELTIDDII